MLHGLKCGLKSLQFYGKIKRRSMREAELSVTNSYLCHFLSSFTWTTNWSLSAKKLKYEWLPQEFCWKQFRPSNRSVYWFLFHQRIMGTRFWFSWARIEIVLKVCWWDFQVNRLLSLLLDRRMYLILVNLVKNEGSEFARQIVPLLLQAWLYPVS